MPQTLLLADADPPDIVLVDVGMPGRSGYEVAQHIKESPRLQHIPVLLLTGAFEPVDETRAASVGCDGVLAKPFEPQLVIARVKDLLGRSTSSDTAEPDPPAVNLVAPMAETEAPANAPADDIWAPKPVGAVEPPKPAQVARLDSYFAELDQAFAALENTAAPVPKTEVADPAPIADMIDWFGATPGATPTPPPSTEADLPLAFSAPAPPAPVFHVAEPESEPQYVLPPEPAPRYVPPPVAAAPEAVPVAIAVQAPPAPVAIPPLADAFAEFLDAEQDDPMSSTDSAWPATLPSALAGHAGNGDSTLSDEAIEVITQRVLDRLSDAVVRERVTDLVSAIAERLVREEIERIKASIQ
jgi:CheY-like chemotaxis protein